jgi:hypothetical protein
LGKSTGKRPYIQITTRHRIKYDNDIPHIQDYSEISNVTIPTRASLHRWILNHPFRSHSMLLVIVILESELVDGLPLPGIVQNDVETIKVEVRTYPGNGLHRFGCGNHLCTVEAARVWIQSQNSASYRKLWIDR